MSMTKIMLFQIRKIVEIESQFLELQELKFEWNFLEIWYLKKQRVNFQFIGKEIFKSGNIASNFSDFGIWRDLMSSQKLTEVPKLGQNHRDADVFPRNVAPTEVIHKEFFDFCKAL